jgi:hypothetical protein
MTQGSPVLAGFDNTAALTTGITASLEREPYLCLSCNQMMVLRRCIPNGAGQPDITVWGCLHCSDKQV